MNIQKLVESIRTTKNCKVYNPTGMPIIDGGYKLPDDLAIFYTLTGGLKLFEGKDFFIEIVGPENFTKSNPLIIEEDGAGDISYDWFIIGLNDSQYISIDLNLKRLGRCYDSFWDRHGVAGECPIIANSFSELIEKLFDSNGKSWYWLNKNFKSLGDAYD